MTVDYRYVRFERCDELECLRVQHPQAQALLALQGAQLLQFRPAGAHPVVWLSDAAAFREGQSVRGGVPVCAPWFGNFERNPGEVKRQYDGDGDAVPAHGLVRSIPWILEYVCEDEAQVVIGLTLPAHVLASQGWSAAVDYRIRFVIGASLRIELHATAGDQPVVLTQALHTYLAVSNIASVSVSGLEDIPFIDTLAGWTLKQEACPVRFDGEIDRIYQYTASHGKIPDSVIIDEEWGRNLRLAHEGARSLVLWNPHIEKTARMTQLSANAWRYMLCIETGNVMDDLVRLNPGESKALSVTISVAALQGAA